MTIEAAKYHGAVREFISSIKGLNGIRVIELHDHLNVKSHKRSDGDYWQKKNLIITDHKTLSSIRPTVDALMLKSQEVRQNLDEGTKSCQPPRIITGISSLRPRVMNAVYSKKADKDSVLEIAGKIESRHHESLGKDFFDMVDAIKAHSFDGLRVIRRSGHAFMVDAFEDDYKTETVTVGTLVIAAGEKVPEILRWRRRKQRSDKKEWRTVFDFDKVCRGKKNLPIGSGIVICEELI